MVEYTKVPEHLLASPQYSDASASGTWGGCPETRISSLGHKAAILAEPSPQQYNVSSPVHSPFLFLEGELTFAAPAYKALYLS